MSNLSFSDSGFLEQWLDNRGANDNGLDLGGVEWQCSQASYKSEEVFFCPANDNN